MTADLFSIERVYLIKFLETALLRNQINAESHQGGKVHSQHWHGLLQSAIEIVIVIIIVLTSR